jgi:hypothetical protein
MTGLSVPECQGRWASYNHIQELNRVLGFEPLSDADAERLEEEARESSSDEVLDRQICAVTDTWIFPKCATRVAVDELPHKAMQAALTGGPWCTGFIADYYDCSEFDDRLTGVLLSRKAFRSHEDGKTYVWITTAVLHDLRILEARLNGGYVPPEACKPPKFAIADGFVAGAFSEIDEATVIERQTVGLAQIRGVVKVVYGGPGNVLNSHLLCWDNRNASIASRVPIVVSRDNFHVILAGPMTPAQELLMAKRHECSGERVGRMHDLLRRVNPLYADLAIDQPLRIISTDSSFITSRLHEGDDTQHLIAHARARQATVARGQNNDALQECTVVESHTILLDTVADQCERDRLARAVASVVSKTSTYVARRSTTILQTTDSHYMERLFPHLLTFGVGGFSTVRCHRYSPRAIVLHYLNLSSNRFAEDPLFKLVMFDYLSTKRVKSGVFLRVGQDPSLATTAMRVTPAQLKSAMVNRAEQRASWKSGQPFAPPAGEASANTLLKSINAATSKMWGSNEERESMVRKADAMTIRFGAPSVFWTLTPNPDHSLVCAFWTGRALPNGRPDSLSKCGELNMPCSSEMARLVMGNTTVQAQYYQTCCAILIDIIFGWDMKANKPKSRRGIFGYVESLLYALEQQGRLFIHHHGVAWVAGLPKTQSDWDRLLGSDDLRRRFEQYCASIFSAELPVYNSIQSLDCPRPDCNGQLFAVSIPRKFKHLLKTSVGAPIVARCDLCEQGFTEPDITLYNIEKQWSALDEEHKAMSTVSAVNRIRQKFCGLSRHAATANVQLSRLLLLDQVHAWTHTRSCVKGRTGTKCRYKFFRKLVPATCLNAANEIVYRRRVGNQWLNPFIPLWRRVLHFNMDARVLWSGDSLQAARYALQYAIKRQSVLDNVAVVNMAFKTRVSREMAHQTTVYAQGIGRLLSLAYSSSGVMEIGAPLATAILHAGEAVTFGCVFERLVLLEGLNLLKNIAVEATIVSRNHQMFAETSISRYLGRPSCLDDMCWYDFCSWISRVESFRPRVQGRCLFISEDPSESRLHLHEHGYRRLEYPRVPEIIGPRLPDASRLGDDDYCENTELYHRMAALLYRPFRDVGMFLDSKESARTHFERWMPFTDTEVARRLEYHQQHYIGLQKAQEYRAGQRASAESESDDDVCEDDDVIASVPLERSFDSQTTVQYEIVPAEYYGVDIDIHMDPDGEPLDHVGDASPVARLLLQTISSSRLPPDESFRLIGSADVVTKSRIRAFEKQSTAVDATRTVTLRTTNASMGTVAVTVETLRRAVKHLAYDPERSPVLRLEPYASIQDVSTHYRLNRLQHVAFALIAVPLLRKIVGTAIPGNDHDLFDDTPVIITSAGGTGKSQIIAAVRALALSWSQPSAVAVVASTGIVAASLQGSTMHTSVGLGINASVVPKHIAAPSDELLQQWAPVHCVIADEVSMIDLGFFGLWEESLQHARENKREDYGGLLTVLMFDHCQLRCVKGLPLFKTSNGTIPLTPAQGRGKELYQKIKKVVYLTENMRFTQDPAWGDWLASGRLGQWPSDCRAYITSLSERVSHGEIIPQGVFKTISTDNTTRAATNDMAVKMAQQCFGSERKIYVVPALLSRHTVSTELELLRQLPDNKTGHIPLFLHIYVGENVSEPHCRASTLCSQHMFVQVCPFG